LELEEQYENGIRGTPDQVIQSKRVLQKLLDEWSTLSITVGQMLLRSPVSKSPSPSPVFSSASPQTSDIMDLEAWLDEIEVKMKQLKEDSESNDSESTKEQLKHLESQISRKHR